MYCKFCKEYIGFSENIICNNKDCVSFQTIIKKYGIKNILTLLKKNFF